MAELNLDAVYQPHISPFDKLETLRYASQQFQSKLESLAIPPALQPSLSKILEAFSRLASDWDSLCEDINEASEAEQRQSEGLMAEQLGRIRAEKEQEARRKRELAVRAVSMEVKEQEFSKSLSHIKTLWTKDVDLLDKLVQSQKYNRGKLSDAADLELAEIEREFKQVLAGDESKDQLKAVNESQIDISMMNDSQVNAAFDRAIDGFLDAEGNEVSGWISELESDKEESQGVEAVRVRRPLDMLKDSELESLPRQLAFYSETSSFEQSKGASCRTLTPSDSRNFNAPRPILKKPGFIVTSPRSAVLAELEKTSSRNSQAFLKIEEMTDSWAKDLAHSSSSRPLQSLQSVNLTPSILKKAQATDYHSTDSTRFSSSSRSKWKARSPEDRPDLLV